MNTCENITLPQASFAGGKNGQNIQGYVSRSLMCKFDEEFWSYVQIWQKNSETKVLKYILHDKAT